MLQLLINRLIGKFKKRAKNSTRAFDLGIRGEKLAVRFLKREKGYRVIERNWRCKNEEIDIIAEDGEVLVFFEVKTSMGESLVPTYYRVTAKKKRVLERACKRYLRSRSPRKKHFRFDIITVKFCQEGKSSIEHYMNVRLFSKNFHVLGDE
ncbi:hypothetical protein AYO37_00205 [Opitutia bacterium SCGC AG-212-L18]|nr:hypothetical protein AYO37_00205 [Opitutae bacterium SCGC AG-212-L18]